MNTRLLSAAILLMSVTAPAHGQQTMSAEDELRALDRTWAHAEMTHDAAALDRILDDGYVATFSSGKTLDKAAFIQTIMRIAFDSATKSVVDAIHIHGDVGVVVERFGVALDTKVTWVAIKTGGRWRVIAEQLTKIAAPKLQ